jgi:hypothetical protein
MGIPKSPRLEVLQLCGTITSCADLWFGWGLNQSFSPCLELFNGMSHTTWTQGNWVNSWLSVVGSQTTSLTPGLSFGHNLCCRCSNGSCELILDIYVSISFQWYKNIHKARGFDLYNHFLKFQESTGTPTPHNGSSFGSVNVYSHTLPYSRTPLLARSLANPCLGCEPKVRVAIILINTYLLVVNVIIMWMHECEQWVEFSWATQNLWRMFLPCKPNILHVDKNIPYMWIEYYIDMARIFFSDTK